MIRVRRERGLDARGEGGPLPSGRRTVRRQFPVMAVAFEARNHMNMKMRHYLARRGPIGLVQIDAFRAEAFSCARAILRATTITAPTGHPGRVVTFS